MSLMFDIPFERLLIFRQLAVLFKVSFHCIHPAGHFYSCSVSLSLGFCSEKVTHVPQALSFFHWNEKIQAFFNIRRIKSVLQLLQYYPFQWCCSIETSGETGRLFQYRSSVASKLSNRRFAYTWRIRFRAALNIFVELSGQRFEDRFGPESRNGRWKP